MKTGTFGNCETMFIERVDIRINEVMFPNRGFSMSVLRNIYFWGSKKWVTM